jgi:hypothetical protein
VRNPSAPYTWRGIGYSSSPRAYTSARRDGYTEILTGSFRDGHTESWWAPDATLGWWGPDGHTRLVIATTDPATLPDKATWYLATNLPRPGGPHDTPEAVHPAADLTEVVRLYGIRTGSSKATNRSKTNWVGPTSKSAPPLRSAGIRHWSIARSRSAGRPGSIHRPHPTVRPRQPLRSRVPTTPERGGTTSARSTRHPCWPKALRAVRAWAHPMAAAATLVESLVQHAPTR